MTDVCTVALLPTKPSSDNDSGFRHNFGAEASLPLTQSAPAVTHKLCWVVVTLWDCHIHADAAKALSWIFFYVFPFDYIYIYIYVYIYNIIYCTNFTPSFDIVYI